nr:hypothetical protein Iba_chr12cCG11080 [Ipomoea batatas]
MSLLGFLSFDKRAGGADTMAELSNMIFSRGTKLLQRKFDTKDVIALIDSNPEQQLGPREGDAPEEGWIIVLGWFLRIFSVRDAIMSGRMFGIAMDYGSSPLSRCKVNSGRQLVGLATTPIWECAASVLAQAGGRNWVFSTDPTIANVTLIYRAP